MTVTSPRRSARRIRARSVAHDIDEQTDVGEVYLRSLVRAQLRLALAICAVLGILLGGLPLIFAVAPQLRSVRLLGVPLPWLVLGVLVYPVLVVCAWFYVRAAERSERDFAELVERS